MKKSPKHGKNTSKLLLTAAVITFSSIAFTGLASSQAATNPENQNDLDVQVNISKKTIIDIQPKSFSWGTSGGQGILPGSQAGPNDEVNGYGRIQLENLGSVDIKEVWFNTSAPSQRPFGTGSASNYDSGNFISIDSNQSASDQNQFVNRVEYGLDFSSTSPNDDQIIYVNTPQNWDYGRFRNTSQEYFWTVDDTTSLDTSVFKIGINPHNESQTGSTDLNGDCIGGDNQVSSSNQCNSYNLNTYTPGSTTYAYTDVEIGAEDVNPVASGTGAVNNDGGDIYCAIMNASQVTADGTSNRPKVQFVKWDKGVVGTGQGDCALATNRTVGSDGVYSNSLTPGDWITMNIRAKIPYGVVADTLPTGNLFVLASS